MGNRAELVGRVTKVHTAKTKYGKPYCFVFFDSSRQSVKLNIWSEGLAKLSGPPSQAWVGTWLSVQGLVDPAYSGRYGTSLSITITSNSQIERSPKPKLGTASRVPARAARKKQRIIEQFWMA